MAPLPPLKLQHFKAEDILENPTLPSPPPPRVAPGSHANAGPLCPALAKQLLVDLILLNQHNFRTDLAPLGLGLGCKV